MASSTTGLTIYLWTLAFGNIKTHERHSGGILARAVDNNDFLSLGRGTGYNKVRHSKDEGERTYACFCKFTLVK